VFQKYYFRTLNNLMTITLLLAAAAAYPHPHGAAPVSPIAGGQGGGAGVSEIDLFTDVIYWQELDFYRLFFFSGGDMGSHSGSIQGGVAAALYPLYLAAFFNGDLFSGEGGEADSDNPAYQGTVNQSSGKTTWNNDLVLFLAGDLLGAFRFNLLFDAAEFTTQYDKDGGFYEYRPPFLTSLQWGRRFGDLDAAVTAGVGWGGRESWTDETNAALVTTTIQEYTTFGFKLEAAYAPFEADYQLSIGLGRSETVTGRDPQEFAVGPVEHLVNLYYGVSVEVADGMSLYLRPRLLLGFYNNDHEAVSGGSVYEKLSSFGFSPMLEAELGWQITGKVFVSVSLSLSAFTASFAKTDSASYWEVTELTVDKEESGSLDFRFAFSRSFIMEAGIAGLFDLGGARYTLGLANLRGGFAFIFKPGM
jgi:hypothetical protein